MTKKDLSSSKPGIQLVEGKSASAVFHEVIDNALEALPDSMPDIGFPHQASVFKNNYLDVLPRFEAARLNSPDRALLARQLATGIEKQLVFNSADDSTPLTGHLRSETTALSLQQANGNCSPGWQPIFRYRDKEWSDLTALGELLGTRDVLSGGGVSALNWLQTQVLAHGPIDLSDRKVVVIGANAEMASTQYLLEAGADVLWLDVLPPSDELIASPRRAGNLTWVETADLLAQPAEILATICKFAGTEPVDLCLYAYAPGQARELKLTVAMNAIVNALPRELVRTVTTLLSPTTATPLQKADIAALGLRRAGRPAWEAIMDALMLLGSGGGIEELNDKGASRTLVGIQGTSYQAAQYLGKLMQAESWVADGVRVSANTAAITKTRSMNHPVFDAAFDGAGAMQVETFSPAQSQCMSGLLAIHDWLNPQTPVPGNIRVHGGIHTLPYPLNVALRTAAAIGFARSPGTLLKLLPAISSSPSK